MNKIATPSTGDSSRRPVNHWRQTPTYDSVKSALRRANRERHKIDQYRVFTCAECGKVDRFTVLPGKSPLTQAFAVGWGCRAAGQWLCKPCYAPWVKAAREQHALREAAAARRRAEMEMQAITVRAEARAAAQPLPEESAPAQQPLDDFTDENPVDWRLGRWPKRL